MFSCVLLIMLRKKKDLIYLSGNLSYQRECVIIVKIHGLNKNWSWGQGGRQGVMVTVGGWLLVLWIYFGFVLSNVHPKGNQS